MKTIGKLIWNESSIIESTYVREMNRGKIIMKVPIILINHDNIPSIELDARLFKAAINHLIEKYSDLCVNYELEVFTIGFRDHAQITIATNNVKLWRIINNSYCDRQND